MELLVITGIAISLAMDAFSVCVAAGIKIQHPSLRHYFRLSWHFGLFQSLMPVIGYYSGLLIADKIRVFDHWIALILLAAIGCKMIWESFKNDDNNTPKDPSRGITLVILSIATSIDAAAVGLSFAALNIPILFPALIIGMVCFIFSGFGFFLGHRIGLKIGKWAERLGGFILVILGIKIFVQHVF